MVNFGYPKASSKTAYINVISSSLHFQQCITIIAANKIKTIHILVGSCIYVCEYCLDAGGAVKAMGSPLRVTTVNLRQKHRLGSVSLHQCDNAALTQ
jgi:hypothetical protein